jgi:hypothetical protein
MHFSPGQARLMIGPAARVLVISTRLCLLPREGSLMSVLSQMVRFPV